MATVFVYSYGLTIVRMMRAGRSQGLTAIAGGAHYFLMAAVLVFVLGSYLSWLIAPA